MASLNIAPGNPMRSLYRVRRVLALIATVTALALAAGVATYAIGAALMHGASQEQQIGR
jgi:hypothetical protein